MIGLAPNLAPIARLFMRPVEVEAPGAVTIGADFRARPGEATVRTVRIALYDAPGRAVSRETTGQTRGARGALGFAEVELAAGEVVRWQGERFEVSTCSRWSSGAAQSAAASNPQSFWEFTARRIVREDGST